MSGNGPTVNRRDALRITAVAGVAAVAGGGLLTELVRRSRLHRVAVSRTQMGTVVTITVVHEDRAAAKRMVDDAFIEMERLEAILSRYRPQSPLSVLNRTGRVEHAPHELTRVMTAALDHARLSEGAFDPTVAPLLGLHARHFERHGSPPGDAEVTAALERVDHRAVRIDRDAIAFEIPGMAVTLDGIAKGHIVDRTVEALAASGADRVIVNAGGDMGTAGPGAVDEPWRVAIQDPHGPGPVQSVALTGEAIATSGDYMRSFTEDRRHHHIIDPRTGYSPRIASSASVTAPTAAAADALSTALLVLGVEGLQLIESLPDTEALVTDKAGRVQRSSGMGRRQA